MVFKTQAKMHFHDLSSATSLNLSENILKCLLCLEMNEDVEDGWIQVNSKQWQELDVAKLIEKHLWAIVSTHL